MRRAGRPRAAARLALAVAVLLCLSGPVAAESGIQLLSGVGYRSQGDAPSFLLGAELVSSKRTGSFFTGYQETMVALHLSDDFSLDGGVNTYTLGLEGAWQRRQGALLLGTEANVHFRYGEAGWAKTAGIGGRGATGRIAGGFRIDYVEGAHSSFPWFQKDLEGVAPGANDKPFYRATASMSALVLPSYNLRWSQDIRWRKPLEKGSGTLGMATGPEIQLGAGRLATQAGILLGTDGIRPLGQIRYDLSDPESRINFQLTAATASLESEGPVLYGWLDFQSERWGFATAVRLEQSDEGTLSPTVYFSIQPKF